MAQEGTLRVDNEAELERRVAIGDAYEASQLYLSQMGRLRQQGRFVEAEDVGIRGSVALVREGNASMATPLALKVVESLTARKAPVDEETCGRLSRLVAAFDKLPGATDAADAADSAGQKLLVSGAALKFASSQASPQASPPPPPRALLALHGARASDLAAAGRYGEAAKHYARADQPEQYAALVKRWASKGYAGERDLFGARCVLHLLASSSPRAAAAARRLYEELVAQGGLRGEGSKDAATPLENFLTLTFKLLLLMESFSVGKTGAAAAYGALLQSYRPALMGRDPKVGLLAQRAGSAHFGWKPPPGPMQGLMDMFKAK
mmetsp:Transcript_46321/g.104606  ORF Transcript_46321/g.104606 Transcript_46321/m.104606 type:complete len:322 (+) Transcript_46321:65-1030(+)